MERTTFSISYYCRKSKATTRGLAPIEVSIIINGQRTFINLPRKIEPETFEKLYNQKKTNELKDYLNVYTQKIYEVQKELMLSGTPITAHTIKEYIKTGGVKTYTLEDLYKDFIEIQRKRNPNVIRKYIITFENLFKLHDRKKEITAINNADADEFLNYLKGIYEQSTLSGQITRIKCIFNFAVNNGKIRNNPFNTLQKISKGEKPISALNKEEIEKIRNSKVNTNYLQKVKDLFLFQMGTGLAYIDMFNLEPNDLKENNGICYIQKKRQKTKVEYISIMLPIAKEIWEKYNGELPVISNQRYNTYLKALGICSGIEKNLHSHLARHTYGTLLLNQGVRLEIVSKAMGHSNTRITQHYAKLKEETIINEIKENFNL
jgi:site-specific recombinase XerD